MSPSSHTIRKLGYKPDVFAKVDTATGQVVQVGTEAELNGAAPASAPPAARPGDHEEMACSALQRSPSG